MHILISPDKFKGSLTSNQVCAAIEAGIKKYNPETTFSTQPLADGGEGTLDILKAVLGLEKIAVTVKDPLMRSIDTYYLRNEKVAFVEMANASGLLLLKKEERNPLLTSTFGTGEMVAHALDNGVREVYLMIGGSATNDGGIGMAQALGYNFGLGEEVPNGAALSEVQSCDKSNIHPRIKEVKFTVLCDVQNPLIGEQGAAAVYGPQKGANDAMVRQLDEGLQNLARVISNGREQNPGAGAAGGLGYGAISFLNAKLKSGIDTVMELTNFSEHIKKADLVITGEGQLDTQTLSGKVIAGVKQQADKLNKPVAVICGIAKGVGADNPLGLEHIYQVMNKANSVEDSMNNAAKYVSTLTTELLHDLKF
ncbi:glycerate kinase [Roseivirga pacifica]|uniref:glycerate kinase n=1 Tax=Roseivirga pacifica TaxID=1267423 RepID=UPI0020959A50|nr:glycerate kinase [Roseivirga pacifica]MCO6359727.1 glycerate kinase [Roseivirga pacifica]MCO6367097.1 glycerate kinase [Roseivirga pacifica]MCO6370371.1 glycerate kinase [Roseivirga pacifica]MCO6374754.1 glycerate kinase [Roseivirga pacifica]MCO6380012.1 glycerate kinase [Roseivirga pacifica]